MNLHPVQQKYTDYILMVILCSKLRPICLTFVFFVLFSLCISQQLLVNAEENNNETYKNSSANREYVSEMQTRENLRNRLEAIVGQPQILYLGAHGELIGPSSKPVIGCSIALTVMDVGDEFELVCFLELSGVKPGPMIYARVKSNGKIELSDRIKMKFKNNPFHWTYKSKSGKLVMPPFGTVIGSQPLNKTDLLSAPKNAQEWYFLGALDHLIVPMSGVIPHENIVWRIPSDEGGFDLVHSGPLSKGVFLHVDEASRITFFDDSNDKAPEDSFYWPKDEEDNLALLPAGYVLNLKRYKSAPVACYLQDGEFLLKEFRHPVH